MQDERKEALEDIAQLAKSIFPDRPLAECRDADGTLNMAKVKEWEAQIQRDREAARDQLVVYSEGILYCSACASRDLTREQVEALVNRLNPSGTSHGWVISEELFASGAPNPSPCNDHPELRLHYLMVC